MISALRGSSPSGKDLNVTAVRSRIFSSTKLFVMASATVMSSLVPSAAFGQAAVAARPPDIPGGDGRASPRKASCCKVGGAGRRS